MRRRKPKVVWLPQDRNNRLGIAPLAASTPGDSAFGIDQDNGIPGGIGNHANVSVVPIIGDGQSPVFLAGGPLTSLSDVEQSGYRLRRIVGKIFTFTRQDANVVLDDVVPLSLIVTCGFIILRVDNTGVPLAVGAGGNASIYDSTALDATMDPWIWRRSWVITNVDGFDAQGAGATARSIRSERNNVLAGSALDGPHVDAKTARIVSAEERLFMVITRTALDGSAQGTMNNTVIWDLRVLASMRSNLGNRRNASR